MFCIKCVVHCQKILLTISVRHLHRTHYDVLKLDRNCTSKEVRKAFINLSKTCHPDKNNSHDSHATYVRIVEAYNILSKPTSRADYDLGLRRNIYTDVHYPPPHKTRSYDDPVQKAWADSSFYANRDKSRDHFHRSQPYYGIRGVNKVANIWIAFVCIWFAVFGALSQYMMIKSFYGIGYKRMKQTSTENGAYLSAVRSQAEANGNEEQINQLISKLHLDKKTAPSGATIISDKQK